MQEPMSETNDCFLVDASSVDDVFDVCIKGVIVKCEDVPHELARVLPCQKFLVIGPVRFKVMSEGVEENRGVDRAYALWSSGIIRQIRKRVVHLLDWHHERFFRAFFSQLLGDALSISPLDKRELVRKVIVERFSADSATRCDFLDGRWGGSRSDNELFVCGKDG